MRPVYERRENVTAQQRVIDAVCRAWKCEAKPSQKFAPHDYVLVRGVDVVAVVEVKSRSNAYEKYPTYMVSAAKAMAGMSWDSVFNVPFLLIVEFTDGIWYCRPATAKKDIRYGGRTDRGDADDMETVAHIPMSEFKQVADTVTAR